MAMRSAFCVFLDEVLTRIDEKVDGPGSHATRRALREELLRFVVLRESPERIRALKLASGLALAKHDDRAYGVANALHAHARHKVSLTQAAKLAGAPRSDLLHVLRLAKLAEVRLDLLDLEVPEEILANVSSYFERLVVRVDQRAVEDLLLAALESYLVPKPGKGQKYSEAYGYCFGTARTVPLGGIHHRKERRINVARVVTQLRNRSSANHVLPNTRSERVHVEIAERFFSHLELVGDYHTHPFKNLTQLRQRHGWKYSAADEISMQGWVDTHMHGGTQPRFSLIAAVAAGGKSGKTVAREQRNRVQYCVDGTFVILVAYRFLENGEYDSDVDLRVPGAE